MVICSFPRFNFGWNFPWNFFCTIIQFFRFMLNARKKFRGKEKGGKIIFFMDSTFTKYTKELISAVTEFKMTQTCAKVLKTCFLTKKVCHPMHIISDSFKKSPFLTKQYKLFSKCRAFARVIYYLGKNFWRAYSFTILVALQDLMSHCSFYWMQLRTSSASFSSCPPIFKPFHQPHTFTLPFIAMIMASSNGKSSPL